MRKISIITTMYNQDPIKLDRTFKSIMSQNYSDIIHFLYDDGSTCTDHFEVVSRYIDDVKKMDNPYKVIFLKGKKNVGVDKAHSICFALVDTDYFMWLDCNDYLEEGFFEKIKIFIDDNFDEYDCYHFNSIHFYQDYVSPHPTSFLYNLTELKNKNQFYNFLSKTNWFYDVFLVKTSSIKTVNRDFYFFDDNGGFFYDAQIMWELCLSNGRFYFFDNINVYFEQSPISVSRGYNYNYSKMHSVMLRTFKMFNLPYSDYLKQTVMYLKNRMIYKSLLNMSRRRFKTYIYAQLSYYKERDLSKILFPKSHMIKLYIVSCFPFLHKLFIHRHRADIEQRKYFY